MEFPGSRKEAERSKGGTRREAAAEVEIAPSFFHASVLVPNGEQRLL